MIRPRRPWPRGGGPDLLALLGRDAARDEPLDPPARVDDPQGGVPGVDELANAVDDHLEDAIEVELAGDRPRGDVEGVDGGHDGEVGAGLVGEPSARRPDRASCKRSSGVGPAGPGPNGRGAGRGAGDHRPAGRCQTSLSIHARSHEHAYPSTMTALPMSSAQGRPYPTGGIRRILLATDLSAASEGAAVQALDLAHDLGADLLIVSVIDPRSLRLPGGRFGVRVDQVRSSRETAAQDLVVARPAAGVSGSTSSSGTATRASRSSTRPAASRSTSSSWAATGAARWAGSSSAACPTTSSATPTAPSWSSGRTRARSPVLTAAQA